MPLGKSTAGADLLDRHDVEPGIVPERPWRNFYIRGLSPQEAADQAAVGTRNVRRREMGVTLDRQGDE
jgi:hypothetical protein